MVTYPQKMKMAQPIQDDQVTTSAPLIHMFWTRLSKASVSHVMVYST